MKASIRDTKFSKVETLKSSVYSKTEELWLVNLL